MTTQGVIVLLILIALVAIFGLLAARESQRRKKLLNARIEQNLGADALKGDRKSEFLQLQETKAAGIALVGLLAVGLVLGSFLNFLVLSIVVVPAVWWAAHQRRLFNLRQSFLVTFPEAVESFSRAIKAGVPLERALEATGANYKGEVGRRFKGLVSDLTLGISFPQSLARFSADLDNADVDFFCQTLALSRETGSPLSPILNTFCDLIRERNRLDRRLAALTAESRASARILCAMPFFILGLQAFMNPTHLTALVHDSTGQMILLYAVLSMLAGFAVITKMTRSLES